MSKLDRILAGQEQVLGRLKEQDETIAAWTAALSVLKGAVDTQKETINRLSEAMSKEGGGDLVAEIASIRGQPEEDPAGRCPHGGVGRTAAERGSTGGTGRRPDGDGRRR